MPPPSLSTTTIRRSADRSRETRPARWSRARRRCRRRGRPSACRSAPGRARSTRRRRCRWRRGSRGRAPAVLRTTRDRGRASTRRRRARRPSGSDAATTCATPGSVSDSSAASDASIASTHASRRGANAPPTSCRVRASEVRRDRRSRTRTRRRARDRRRPVRRPGPPRDAERAIHSASTLEAGGRPMRTTTSGVCASANSRWRSNESNVVTAAGNDRAPLDSGRRAPAIRSRRRAPRCARPAHPLRPPATITPRWRSTTAPSPALGRDRRRRRRQRSCQAGADGADVGSRRAAAGAHRETR